jgi:CRISPR-associated protein Csb2
LTAAQQELLGRLLGKLNYLGRSESWVEAGLHPGKVRGGVACEPMMEGGMTDGEMVPVACPVPAEVYAEKRAWLSALTYSTTEFLKDRRSLPPAMRLVPYARARNAVMTRAPRLPGEHAGVQAVVMSLDAKVLPLVTSTIEVAEQIRVRLMGIHKKLMDNDPTRVSSKFSGKMPDGSPRKDHQHAFILPLRSEREPIRIDRVLVRTTDPEGFDHDEVRTILRMNELYGRTSEDPIRVMATKRVPAGTEYRRMERELASTTPFCPPRHWRKGRGMYIEFLAEEIRRECRHHGMAEPRLVRGFEGSGFAWVEYRRNRKDDEPRAGYGFRLEFDRPVPVPFSLGYGCHFGLGQFDAVE